MTATPDSSPMRVVPSLLEEWVKDRVSRFAVLAGIEVGPFPNASLVAIMSRLDYTPKREHLAGHHRLDPDATPESIGLVTIATKHISAEMLSDLDAEIELAEADSRVEVIKPGDGTVWVDDGGKMVYTDREQEKPDLTEDHGTGWASW